MKILTFYEAVNECPRRLKNMTSQFALSLLKDLYAFGHQLIEKIFIFLSTQTMHTPKWRFATTLRILGKSTHYWLKIAVLHQR